MHGRVFAHETLAEATFVLEKEVAVAVVVEHAPSQVQQGPQLAEGVAVSFHFPGVVRQAEKDAAAIRGDVASFLDDVEEAAAHHLQKRKVRKKKVIPVPDVCCAAPPHSRAKRIAAS